jgi:hypothetical protein
LKTTIFDTVSILSKIFVKLIDINESNTRKITELERQVANTNAVLGEVKGRTNNSIAEPSSAPARVTHRPDEEVTPPGGEKVKLYLVAVEGKTKTEKIQTDCNYHRQPNSR